MLICLAGASSALHAQTAQRIYELNNSFTETNGGSNIEPNGGPLSATGYSFALGQGLTTRNALANTGEYSIEMIARIDTVSGMQNLFNFNDRSANPSIYSDNGSISFIPYAGGKSSSVDFVSGRTYRIVITRNASTKVTTAYVDGQQKAQVTDTSDHYVASGPAGVLHFFRDDVSENAAGYIDQIRIYHSVLTPSQVAALSMFRLAPWQAVVNAGTPAATQHTTVAGTSPVYVNVGTFALGSPRSFEFVFNAAGAGPSKSLLGNAAQSLGGQALKLHQFNNTGRFGITRFGVADDVFANSSTLSNQEVHAVFTSNGSVTTLYLNGVAQSGTINYGLALTGTQALGAFANTTTIPFLDNLDGTISGFASYARALTPGEVRARYSALDGTGSLSAPVVTSPTSASITGTTATLGGNVASENTATLITERGVVYSVFTVNTDPLIGGSGVTKITAPGTTGVFTIGASNLSPATDYVFKAYAINSQGTTYTNLGSFRTSSPNIFTSLVPWRAVVNADSPAVTHFTSVAGSSPVTINVGTFTTGSARSFEFVFNAVGAGPSKTLLGSEVVASGAQYLKLNQFSNTGRFGMTTAGVADSVFANSPTISGEDVHAVFTSNGSVTTLYLNGVAQTGTISQGLRLTGSQALGAIQRITAPSFADNLDGTIKGFASYARALTQAEVTARYNALLTSNGPPSVFAASESVSTPAGVAPTMSGGFFDPDGNATVALTANVGTVIQNNAAGTWTWTGPIGSGPSTTTVIITATDTGSGGQVRFANFTSTITAVDPITINTPTSAGITALTATLGGTVVSDGGGAISERGVVFARTATNADPLIGGAGVTKITVSGTTGVFTTGITNLTPGTQYSFKAYAINFAGTTYTSVATFSTLANNPPVVTVNSPNSVSTPEGTAPTKSGTFSDVQGNASVTLTSSSGSIVQNNTAGTWIWTGPVSNEPGSSTVTITATDSEGAVATANFTSIITNVDPPTITAPTSASIAETSAILGGNVTSDGGDGITERGVVYAMTATNANPLIGGAGVTKITAPGTTGVFTTTASNLTVQTGYSFKAYAINSGGISYTSVATFTTLPSLAPWRAVVLAGNPVATYDNPVNGANPVLVNVGNLAGINAPRSFEFVFNAAGAGPSKSLLGRSFPSGAQSLKLHQFNNTGKFGVTRSGVADNIFTNSPTISNQPVHAVFTSNGIETTLYLNGVGQSGKIADRLDITGLQYLGATQISNQPAFSENLDGTIFGFASYARALTQEEVTARYNALSGIVPIASPGVTAPTLADLTETTVTLGGNVVNDRGAPITERGVIYSATMTNADPVIGGPGVTKITVPGTTGVFTSSVTNLTELTRYSFKAYAINSEGVSYSGLINFTTLYDTELWQAVVEAGNPAVIYYVPTDGANPVSFPVGNFAEGSPRSFEFVFTAAGAGPSKTLLGDESGSSGAQYLKLNQFNNTGKFGISTRGVADDVFANSPTLSNQMVHAVFTSNGLETTLYLNGVAQSGTINRGLRITGTNGFGALKSNDPSTYQDNLDGTISGFASYARALTPQEVTARYNALVGILPPDPSFVTAPTSAAITGTTATLGGRVVSDYGAPITERGVVFAVTATNADPLIGGPGVTKITTSGTTGVFTTNAINLTELTGYSFKAYAVNSRGIAYTSVATFTTLADIGQWRALVNADNPANVYHLTVDGTNPVSINVGDFAIGSPRSFEFVFNAAGAGPSKTLLGNASSFFGRQALKLNQFNNSGKFGLSTFGVADSIFADSPTISGQRVHAVFASDGSQTTLFLNGVAQSGPINQGLRITGTNGLGGFATTTAPFFADNLDGRIFGFASYGRALTQAEVTARYNALLQTPPVVTTPTSADITASTATLGGDVVSDGSAAITERGVVYSITATNADPLIGGSGVTKITASGTTGVFTANAINLSGLTGYSFKAYAVNSQGTTYTPVATFSTLANPASGYAGWVAAEGLTGLDAQPNAQPFGDGLANVLKYAFNMPLDGPRSNLLNPNAGPGANGLPVFIQQLTGPNPIFRVQFLRRKNSDLTYVPQWSTNLSSPFTPMLADEVVTPIDTEWELVTVDEPLDLPLPPTFFGRVKVTLP